MTREELIKKWLNNELDARETEAFRALEDYDDLMKLNQGIQAFKAPDYDVSEGLSALKGKINSRKSRNPVHWKTHLLRIAAVVVIAVGTFFLLQTGSTEIRSEIAQKINVELPDDSEVILNSGSFLSFNEKKWSDNRTLELDGEAYFKVEKGSAFTVKTAAGSVTVLGTQFNVKERSGIFEVACFEGSVRVDSDEISQVLKPGDRFLILDGKYIATEKDSETAPSWIDNQSYFKSLPFGIVIDEFERQYGVNLEIDASERDLLFTGTFVHNDINLALKSITLPLNLSYSQVNDNTIRLTRE